MSSRTRSSPSFWRDFVATTWGRRPEVFKGFLGEPPCTPGDLFDVIREGARRIRLGAKDVNLRFYGDGHNLQVREDFEAFLPRTEERELDAFEARLRRERGAEWGFALNNIHCYSRPIWELARELMHGLFAELGLPGDKVSVETFFGPYGTTPFGVHRDYLHVFTLPVIGQKVTHVWPYQPMASALGLSDPDGSSLEVVNTPFRANPAVGPAPIQLVADVGDLTYWPPSAWHLAVGNGSLTGTMVIAVSASASTAELIRRLGPKPSGRVEPSLSSESSTRLRVEQVLTEVERHVEGLRGSAFRERLHDEFEVRASSCGFWPPVEASPGPPLQLHQHVTFDPRFPIRTSVKSDRLDCFVNGHALTVEPPGAMSKLISHLNQGGVFSVEALCTLTSGWLEAEGFDGDAAYVLDFLNACVSFRALTCRASSP